jgi:hypothetical protein
MTLGLRVRVTSTYCGELVSGIRYVTVNPRTAVVTQPLGFTGCFVGNTQPLAVAAEGMNLTYVWQYSINSGSTWTTVPGATSASYVPSPPTGATGTFVAIYRCVITGECGIDVTTPVTVQLEPAPTITTQPTGPSSMICPGTPVTLTFAYSAPGTATIAWEQSTDDGATYAPVAGATSTTLSLATVPQTTYYRGVVSTPCTTIRTSVIQVSVGVPVSITQQPPATAQGCAGDATALYVEAEGTNLVYRWEANTGTGWQAVAGGNVATLNLTLANSGQSAITVQYRCAITGRCTTTPMYSNTTVITIQPGLNILTQPTSGWSTTVCVGATTALSFVATGAVSQQWEASDDGGATWAAIPGATGTGLTTPPITAGSHLFRARLVGACGQAVYTLPAEVVGLASLAITTQPSASQSVCSNDPLNLQVVANRSDVTYQWYSAPSASGPWSLMTGATEALLSAAAPENLTGSSFYRYYRVQVTPSKCGGTATSTISTIEVRPGTLITAQPQAVDTCLNSVATVSVAASGMAVTVQWQADYGSGFANVGVTANTWTLPTGAIGTYSVRAVITGTCGAVVSDAALVKVSGPTAIQQSPQSVTVCPGTPVELEVQATGAALTYRWERSMDNGTTWTQVGLSLPRLTIVATATAQYRVTVFGGAGCNDSVMSAVAVVTVKAVPADVPLDVPTYALAGHQVYLSVAAGGPAYDTVTWTINGTVLQGQSVVYMAPADAGSYRIVVVAAVNGCSSSAVWDLTVIHGGNGDANQDRKITGEDYGRLLAAIGSTAGTPLYDAALDMNGDGVIDASDEALFLQVYALSVQAPTTQAASFWRGEYDDAAKALGRDLALDDPRRLWRRRDIAA